MSGDNPRTPNTATHVTIYVDGLATLACNMHTEMALRAGGFAFEIKAFPLRWHVLKRPGLSRRMTAAIVSTDARSRARAAVYEDELPELEPTVDLVAEIAAERPTQVTETR